MAWVAVNTGCLTNSGSFDRRGSAGNVYFPLRAVAHHDHLIHLAGRRLQRYIYDGLIIDLYLLILVANIRNKNSSVLRNGKRVVSAIVGSRTTGGAFQRDGNAR